MSGRSIGDPRRGRLLRTSTLVLADAVVMFFAGAFAYLVWALPMRSQPASLYLSLLPLIVLFLLIYWQTGLYGSRGLAPAELLRRSTMGTASGFAVLAVVSFALKWPYVYSRVTFAITLLLVLLGIPSGRWLLDRIFSRRWWWREPAFIVGGPEWTEEATKRLEDAPGSAFRVAGAFVPEEVLAPDFDEKRDRRIRWAVLHDDAARRSEVFDVISRRFAHMVVLSGNPLLPVEGLRSRVVAGVAGIEFTNNLLRRRNRILKRVLDLALGSVLLIVALPVICLAIVAILLVDRGSPFFWQQRVGHKGGLLVIPKLRTMRRGSDQELEEVFQKQPELSREWREGFKMRRDPRLLPVVGRLLRRFSIDELPQLALVLVGSMSLVGPRPFPEYHVARFSDEFRRLREGVRPGLTGLWQVEVRSEGGIAEQESYDSYYIRNWSVWLDLYILARTVGAVLSGRGAY